MLGKVTRFLVLKFPTSEVISKDKTSRAVEITLPPPPPSAFRAKPGKKIVFTNHFQNFLAKMAPRCRIQGS